MYCRHCAKELLPQAVICVGCGCSPKTGNQFCPHCASPTKAEAVVCLSCGCSVTTSRGVGMNAAFSNDFKDSINNAVKQPVFWAAVVIIVAFFLPWLDYGVITVSGWELRDLVRFIKVAADENFRANSLLNLMYFLPILGLLLILSFFTQNEFIQKRHRTWKILTGIYPWLFFFSMMLKRSDATSWTAYGLYITLAAAAYLLYSVFQDRKNTTGASHNALQENAGQETAYSGQIQRQTVSSSSQPPVHNVGQIAQKTINHSVEKENNRRLILPIVIGSSLLVGVVITCLVLKGATGSSESTSGVTTIANDNSIQPVSSPSYYSNNSLAEQSTTASNQGMSVEDERREDEGIWNAQLETFKQILQDLKTSDEKEIEYPAANRYTFPIAKYYSTRNMTLEQFREEFRNYYSKNVMKHSMEYDLDKMKADGDGNGGYVVSVPLTYTFSTRKKPDSLRTNYSMLKLKIDGMDKITEVTTEKITESEGGL